ncbi:hypothetical protein IW261DRAFT_1572698 [Armillaria novae-zelandiae]|uniref:Uncharacterized protein n=1 Tax=Armillaria novae-zelandiae TaxID=153914 RepID=A0AA39U9S9_9AGAR|nr:hypothetical protein IW261DRAFT_1572698 [Armillaria novae-zelandiae]
MLCAAFNHLNQKQYNKLLTCNKSDNLHIHKICATIGQGRSSRRQFGDEWVRCVADPDSPSSERTCPSRAIRGPLTSENRTIFEGLMLMWDEVHQSSKELDRLHRKIDRLEEAIEVLLGDENRTVKGMRMEFGIGKVCSLSISLNCTKKSIRSGSQYLTSRVKQQNYSRHPSRYDKSAWTAIYKLKVISDQADAKTTDMLTGTSLVNRLHPHDWKVNADEFHPSIIDISNDEPIVYGEVRARTPLFELSDDEENKATVQLRSQQTPFSVFIPVDPEIISQVFDEKVPIYLNQYRRLNPRLVSWKHVKPEDQNALVALQNTLIRDIFNHEYFDQGIHIDLITHSRKQWEDNFCKGFKNRADHLKNAQSSLSTNPRMDSSDGSHPLPEPKPSDNPQDAKHMSDAIHKLAKMLCLSGNLTGHQWFELEKKAEIKAFLAEKHHARCVGGSNEAGTEGASLDLENPGREYQLMVKLWWNALTSEKQAEWDKEVKKIEHSITDNREDLLFIIPDFLDLLCSDKVIGPALCYFYVAWRKEDGHPTVLSYANTVNGKTLQEIVTDREVGATPEERKHAWGSRLAREAAMILPESLAVRSTTEDFPPFVPFDKTKCTPDQWAKYIHTFFDTVWNHCNPTMVLPWQELMVAPEKFYDQTIHKFPVLIHDSSITPYTINKCVMLLEYLEKECVAGTDHPFHFYSVLTCTSATVLSSRSTNSFAHALPPAPTSPQPSPSFRKPPSSPDNPPLSSLLGHPCSPLMNLDFRGNGKPKLKE